MRFDSERYLSKYLESFSRRNFAGPLDLPSMEDIGKLERSLINLFYPANSKCTLEEAVNEAMIDFALNLHSSLVYKDILSEEAAEKVIDDLMSHMGEIRRLVKKDAIAGLEGDPAAKSLMEVIICYPAFRALSVYRVAHHLFTLGVPLLPRMMSEYVHSLTGIDIHPGATIGESFFIDHGTGVVIGETCVIGCGVKLYQGVTLGALSFPKNEGGNKKRHPTIEDNVTIYANATILGDIVIGANSTIGSSCWIKTSIAPNSLVTNADPEIIIRQKRSRS